MSFPTLSIPYRRIAIDAAGYLLILLGLASGWLPGPGGIPLILGGLGLLSINNAWAKRWREWLALNAGNLVKWMFPKHQVVQWMYDILAVVLLGLVMYLGYQHAAIWQISLATVLFILAIIIVGYNRDRASNLRVRFGKGNKKVIERTSEGRPESS
jgi:hypothetical protein